MNILDFICPFVICAHRSNAKSLGDCKENFNMHPKDRTEQILGANWLHNKPQG